MAMLFKVWGNLMKSVSEIYHEVLTAIRKVIRAIDLNSKKIFRKYGLTGPQLVILKTLDELGECPVGALAKHVLLSHATVTDIVYRLEKKGYVNRIKSKEDKRKIFVCLTETSKKMLLLNPFLMQEKFVEKFNALSDHEQYTILSSLEKLAILIQSEDPDF